MPSAASQPNFRLVGVNDRNHPSAASDLKRAQLEVVKENRIAAHAPMIAPGFAAQIDPHDPRWIMAMQTLARLQGATLTPERRELLLKSGRKLGLRAFESNLIIAIVQDRVRAGLPTDGAGPLLRLVAAPASQLGAAYPGSPSRVYSDSRLGEPGYRHRHSTWPKWFAALSAAAVIVALLMRWLASA